MFKKMLLSLSICLLIPTCIAVYTAVYFQVKNEGDLFGTLSNVVQGNDDVVEHQEEEPVVNEDNENEAEPSNDDGEEDKNSKQAAEPEEEPQPNRHSFKGRNVQMRHVQSEDHIRITFVETDDEGNVVEEWEKTLRYEELLQPNSERYLEILAEEFVRFHFEHEPLDVYYAGELVRRNGDAARVDVVKTNWKDNFYKEKYNVLIDLNSKQPKPISIQQVRM